MKLEVVSSGVRALLKWSQQAASVSYQGPYNLTALRYK